MSFYPEQQSNGVVTTGEPIKPPAMSLIDALAVLSASQFLGHRRWSDLKRQAQAIVDAHAKEWLPPA